METCNTNTYPGTWYLLCSTYSSVYYQVVMY